MNLMKYFMESRLRGLRIRGYSDSEFAGSGYAGTRLRKYKNDEYMIITMNKYRKDEETTKH